jgi:hypothetical protein
MSHIKLYVKFKFVYNDEDTAELNEEWVKLDTFQTKLNEFTLYNKLQRSGNVVYGEFFTHNINNINSIIKWLLEDEQKEFLIELESELNKDNCYSTIFSNINEFYIIKNGDSLDNINYELTLDKLKCNVDMNKFYNEKEKYRCQIPDNIRKIYFKNCDNIYGYELFGENLLEK